VPESNKIKRRGAGQRGSAIVELSICLLGFLMLTLGAMDFAWAVYAYNFCSSAAQDAARAASVHGSHSTTPWAISDVQTYVKNESVGLTKSNFTITPCWSGDCASTAPASGENDPGDTVAVTVQYLIQPLTGLGIKQNFTVGATAQFVINN